MSSPSWNDRLSSLAIDAAIVAGGAALTALAQWAGGTDLGVWGPVIVATLTALASAVRRLGEPAAQAVERALRGPR